MSLFNKKDGNEVEAMTQAKEELSIPPKDFHRVSREFSAATKESLYREWNIFESRYGAVLNLKEDASKVEVKRALARVKRAAMDVRDALKDLGKFTT